MFRRLLSLLLSLCAVVFGAACASAQITPPHLVRTPDIHGDKVVFSSEGDLWLGSLASGTAVRLSADEGAESNPRFSPDGKWIAFTGDYDGGQDVYVMAVDGGAPRRVTYDPAGAEMVGWTPDGKKILFRSGREVPMLGPRLYLVDAAGGVPASLPMEAAAQGAFAPGGKRLAYCRLPMENHHWKRYHGGLANHIWIADLDKKTFRRINDNIVNEQYPVWIGEQILYVSEKDGTANLWSYDVRTGQAARLTSHDNYDVAAPASDGEQVIYQWGDGLWVYDLKSKQDRPVKLHLLTDMHHARPYTVAGKTEDWGIGPTGKRLVVQGRGQLFTVPVENGDIRQIAPASGSRAKQPAWSPDGKWIAFISDRGGEENLWLAPAGGGGDPIQLTHLTGLRFDSLAWSPDSKQIALRDNTNALDIIDISTKVLTPVVRSDYGAIPSFAFSPDSRWLAYSYPVNFFVQSLCLYNIAQKRATPVTTGPTRDSSPTFDPAGKYLFFLSERNVKPRGDGFDFQYDFTNTTKVYALTLAHATPGPLPLVVDEEPVTEAKPAGSTGAKSAGGAESKPTDGKGGTDTDAKSEEGGKSDAPGAPATPLTVELDGIAERIVALPIPAGTYSGLRALDGKLLYLSADPDQSADSDSDEGQGAKLMMFDFTAKKQTQLAAGVKDFDLTVNGKKMAIRTQAGIQVADAGTPITAETSKVDLSAWRIQVDPPAEWKQIFEEAWRNERDVFYDEHLHGQDWEVVRRRYEALLPAIGSRSDLNIVIGEMQAEMNVSHEFVGGGSGRRSKEPSPGFGALGADLTYDSAGKAYRFARIFEGDGFDDDGRSPLLAPGLNIHEGDYLLAINGTPLRSDQDPEALLIGLGGKVVTLQINGKPTPQGARLVRIKTLSDDATPRYYDWVERCRDYVRKNGGQNLGYIHIPDMGTQGITEFTKYFYANLDKDGIILDVRYNSGGFISGQILERLRRVVFEYDQGRYGLPTPYHPMAYQGRLVVLCNEHTSSDGEYFCTGFHAMKLGATVGTRTWGGFMAVGGFQTIDGGFVSTPVQGSFAPGGNWLPDGYGFAPEHVVEEDPNALAAGHDPQLDKAIAVLQEEIRSDPPPHLKRIEPPFREKAFGPNKK